MQHLEDLSCICLYIIIPWPESSSEVGNSGLGKCMGKGRHRHLEAGITLMGSILTPVITHSGHLEQCHRNKVMRLVYGLRGKSSALVLGHSQTDKLIKYPEKDGNIKEKLLP